MSLIRRRVWAQFVGVALCTLAGVASAQKYPSKTMSFVVPYPAGGGSDFVARQIQPELSKLLGQAMIVDNVGGVGGALGVQKVLSVPADGHTLLLGSPMELVLTPLSMSTVKFKPEDLQLAAQLVTTSMVLATRKDLPVNNIDELMQLIKKPGAKELSFGSVGYGSLYHLVAEKFAQQMGVKMIHVPYKGQAPLMADLMGGQIDFVFMPLVGAVPGMIQEGKFKALGVTSKTPNARLPQLAPLALHKALDDFEFDLWAGVEVPKNTPPEVVQRLNKVIYESLQNEGIRKAYEGTGNTVAKPMSVAELAQLYAKEIVRYQNIARSINLQPQ